mmetsp:Transcript_38420/g.44027  ORF Transcript_38420/g.44027 Transcript_38420/m.44027 type:complete len:93 (-) Transcript_38420:289-567(-)
MSPEGSSSSSAAKASTRSFFQWGASKQPKGDSAEDENRELKELYEMVLKSKKEALEIMNMKIVALEKKVKDKNSQLTKEKETYDDTIQQLDK